MRFVYAINSAEEKALNLAGQLVSHYDTAGLTQTDRVALIGVPLSVTRRLLKDSENPDAVADWQGADASVWSDLLAAELFTTLTITDAAQTNVDARGNQQGVAYDLAGLAPEGRHGTGYHQVPDVFGSRAEAARGAR